MTLLIGLFIATCFLAYSNGANDNFKGVATLFGSGTTDYRRALWWATITTFAGSVCSIFLAQELLQHFSGKGLVPDNIAGSLDFLTAVALGAGLTVIAATLTGFPISTTHSLTGALLGTGVMAVGKGVNFSALGGKFLLPLLFSPLLAILLGSLLYTIFRYLRLKSGINKEWCICAGETEQRVLPATSQESITYSPPLPSHISIDSVDNCTLRYAGNVIGIEIQKIMDGLHFLSAGVVSFARGLNDTPKIMALLLGFQLLDLHLSMFMVAIAMALGGLLNAKNIAHTMSKRITLLNHGQGFSANLSTGLLVIFASSLGMPVSTTHVSVGSLFGIGIITRQGDHKVISKIFMSWVLTLPIAAGLSAVVYAIL